VHNTRIMHLWHYSSGRRYLRWSAPVMPTWNLVPPTCPWHPQNRNPEKYTENSRDDGLSPSEQWSVVRVRGFGHRPHQWRSSVVKYRGWGQDQSGQAVKLFQAPKKLVLPSIFRLDALALSVIATATWLGGWVAGCPSQPVLYQND